MFRMLERIGFFVNGYLDSVIIYIIDLSAIIFRWQVLRHFTHGIKTKSPVTSILLKPVIMTTMKHLLMMLIIFMTLSCSHSDRSINTDTVLDRLYQHHELWRGTPYQLGGMSRQGIDCSGFVQLTFAEQFGVQLPRTTGAQSKLKPNIKRHDLRAGDLVFFKIPKQRKLFHVGIYLEDGRFLHASTSQGVVVSTLTTDYWQDNYWQSIRVLDR